MDTLTQADLKRLMNVRQDNCVTIYAPMVSDEPQNYDGNRIRFKNGLTDVRTALTERGMAEGNIDDYLKPLSTMLSDETFWGLQSSGLAAFLADDFVETYRLPLEFRPMTVVGTRFSVKPMLPFFENDQLFYILAMSQNKVRLFACTRHGCEEEKLHNVPTSLAEALAWDDPEKRQQGHTAAMRQGRGDNTDIMYHGHDPADEQLSNLKRFAWQIRNGLAENLSDAKAPIVLAGTPDTVAYLRDSADFNFTEQTITGNPDQLSGKQLHEKAWPHMAELFSADQAAATEKYNTLAQTDQVTTDRAKVVQAAYFGAIDTLFIPAYESLWGQFDKETGEVSVHSTRQADSFDLFDAAAVKTLENGGKVYISDGSTPQFGAMLRYTSEALAA